MDRELHKQTVIFSAYKGVCFKTFVEYARQSAESVDDAPETLKNVVAALLVATKSGLEKMPADALENFFTASDFLKEHPLGRDADPTLYGVFREAYWGAFHTLQNVVEIAIGRPFTPDEAEALLDLLALYPVLTEAAKPFNDNFVILD